MPIASLISFIIEVSFAFELYAVKLFAVISGRNDVSSIPLKQPRLPAKNQRAQAGHDERAEEDCEPEF